MQGKWSQLPGVLYLLPLFGVIGFSVVPQFWAIWFTFLVAGIMLYKLIVQGVWKTLPIPQSSLWFVLLMAITVLQWMLGSLHSHAVALTTLGYLFAATWMVIAGHAVKQLAGWRSLAAVSARAATATALAISLVAVCSMQPFALWFDLTQTVSQFKESAGMTLALGLNGWLYLAATRQQSNSVVVISAALLLTGIGLLMAGNGWWLLVMLLAVAVVQQVIAIRTESGSREKRRWLHLALLLIPAYALISAILPAAPVTQAAGWWQTLCAATQIALAHPWWGVGAGNVGWQSFLAITQPAIAGRVGVFSYAPNALLQLWLEFGLLALVALLITISAWLRGIRWAALQTEQLWLLSSLALMLAVGLFSAPFHHAYYLLLLAFLLGVGDTHLQRIRQARAGAWLAMVTLLGLLLALGTSGVANVKLTHASRGSLQHPETVSQLQWVHQHSLLAPFAEAVFVRSVEIDHSEVQSKLWLTQSVMRYQPNVRTAYAHSLLLELAGHHDQARAYLNATLNAYPIKLNNMLAYFSPMYMQIFLNLLIEVRPPKHPTPPPASAPSPAS